jgi:hypothetical protein
MATATTESVRLPPGPRIPRTIQGIAFLTALCEVVPALADVLAACSPSFADLWLARRHEWPSNGSLRSAA